MRQMREVLQMSRREGRSSDCIFGIGQRLKGLYAKGPLLDMPRRITRMVEGGQVNVQSRFITPCHSSILLDYLAREQKG